MNTSYIPDSEERTDRASANSSLDTVRVSMELERTGPPSAEKEIKNKFYKQKPRIVTVR